MTHTSVKKIDLRPEVVNIALYKGDAWAVHVQIFEDDGVTPMVLTGATIQAELEPTDGTAEIDLVITPDNLATGQFYFGQTATTLPGKYDVEITKAGVPRTYVRGSLSVTDDITD